MIAMMSFMDGGPSLPLHRITRAHRQRGDVYKNYAKCHNLWQREIMWRGALAGRFLPSCTGFDKRR
jgi:hypothetical protein